LAEDDSDLTSVLNEYGKLLPKMIFGKNDNLGDLAQVVLFQASLKYELPPISFRILPINSTDCYVDMPQHGNKRIEISQGLINLLVEITFAIGRCIRFAGRSGYDSGEPVSVEDVANWLAPRIDRFASGEDLPKGVDLRWMPDLNNEGCLQQLDFISILFRGAFRLLIAHETAHVVILQGYRNDALAQAEAIAKDLPYSTDASWPEELAADLIGAELAIAAWYYGDFLRLFEEYKGELHQDIGNELSAYCAGMNLLLEFIWMVENRSFNRLQDPLFISHPAACFRKFALLAPLAHGIRAIHPVSGGEIEFERDLVWQMSNGIHPLLMEIATLLGLDTWGLG
jgi:hypothetical protein